MANPFDRFDGGAAARVQPDLQAQRDADRTRILQEEMANAKGDPVQTALLTKEMGGAPAAPAAPKPGGNPFDRFDVATAAPAAAPQPKPAAPMPPLLNAQQKRMIPRQTSPDKPTRPDIGQMPYEVGGRVTDATGSPLAGYIANVGMSALPIGPGGAAGGALAPPIQSAAKSLMWSALKPSMKEIRSGKAVKAVETLLNEGISVTKGGVAKLRGKISELNDQISTAIKNSPATVDKNAAASELQGLMDRMEKQVTPQGDMAAVKQAWDDFLNHPLFSGKDRIPVELAQELKQGTYRALGDKAYGELKGASVESQKTLARGLKEQIAKEVPGIGPLNAKESEMLNALTPTEYRVLMNMNKNPGGMGWLTADPKKFAAFMADRSPAFKSILARVLNAGSTAIPRTAGQMAGGGASAVWGRSEQPLPPPP